jgi:8-oxo-dGTP pyrophosphatase MutT (NUDIX family)
MLKKYFLFIILSLDYLTHGMEAMVTEDVTGKHDRFGIFCLEINNNGLSASELTQRLITKINEQKEITGTNDIACRINLPHALSRYISIIQNIGFFYYHGSDIQTEWMVKGQSAIPAPATSIAGARTLLFANGFLLISIEKFDDTKGVAMVPGGAVEKGECVHSAAIREFFEETGLSIDKEHLASPILVVNRVQANCYGCNDQNHFFIATEYEGDLSCQTEELISLFWAPIQEVLTGQVCTPSGQVYPVDDIILHITKKLYDSSYTASLTGTYPDYRQHGRISQKLETAYSLLDQTRYVEEIERCDDVMEIWDYSYKHSS